MIKENRENKFIECPNCKKLVKPSYFEDHLCIPVSKIVNNNQIPSYGIEESNANKKDESKPFLDGVEIENPEIAEKLKNYVVDESGMLLNPNLLEEETRKRRSERKGTKYSTSKEKITAEKPSDVYSKIKHIKEKPKNSKQRIKPIEPTTIVSCPLCKAERKYNELYDHIISYHPKEKAKIVLDKFNREHKIGKYRLQLLDEDIRNINVSPKETFYQADDDRRYGGKNVGYVRRERGRYGSLPMYDDHSDEADAK